MWEGLAGIPLVTRRSCWGFFVPGYRMELGSSLVTGDVPGWVLWHRGVGDSSEPCGAGSAKLGGVQALALGQEGDRPLAQPQGQKCHCPALRGTSLPTLGLR